MLLAPLVCCMLLRPGDVASAIAAGDEAFARIDYAAAVAQYEEVLADHPAEPQLLWRLARAYVCMGEVAEGGTRVRLLKSAEEYARRCVETDSLNPGGHTWLAGALGYLALDEDLGRKVSLSQELHREALRAITLDSNNDAAYSILGSFYRALGNVSWLQRTLAALFVGSVPRGGFAEAEEALQKAIAIAPRVMRHRYELGVLYLDMGRNDEARVALALAETLPVRTAIDRPRLAKIRELLAGLAAR